MYKLLKCLHLLGFTLFLGSVWVYIAMGTPLEPTLITAYVRTNVKDLVTLLTIPGLITMIATGMLMSIIKNKIISRQYLIIKSLLSLIILIITLFIVKAIRLSAVLVDKLPQDVFSFQYALKQEIIFGAINVSLIVITLVYAIFSTKFKSRGTSQ